jgi:hypothetical protein
MVEVRLLVPVADNKGKEHAAGEIIHVDDDTAEAWHAAGKVSFTSVEQAQINQEGHYSDVTGREDVAPLSPGASAPGPQAEEESDEDAKPKKGKK